MDLESDYDMARFLLLRPCTVFSVRSLRDVLALIQGVAIGRYPPHGSGFLPGFSQFVQRRLNGPPCAEYITLLKHYGHQPWTEGCAAVLALLEEWKKTNGGEQQ
jgi:hypothetical protein